MAKKRTVSRGSSSSRGKKKAASTRKSAAKKARTGSPKQLDFGPIKKQLNAHMEKLKVAKGAEAQNTLERLQRVQAELTSICEPTMMIPIP